MFRSSRSRVTRSTAARYSWGSACLFGFGAVACGGSTELYNPANDGGAASFDSAGNAGRSPAPAGAGGTSAGGMSTAGNGSAGGPGQAGAFIAAGAGGIGTGGAGPCANAFCDDQNPCTVDSCDNGLCRHDLPNFDDGNACTVDGCDAKTGVYHAALSVNDMNACTADLCNPLSGVSHSPVPIDDKNPCTEDSCNPGSGIAHSPINLDDKNACTLDACNPFTGVISHTSQLVDDGNACTADFCDPGTGMTFHSQILVEDGNLCTLDSCDPFTGTITHSGIDINDANACTTDTCEPFSGLIQHVSIDCNDNNPCTVDSCNPAVGCQHTSFNTFFSEDFSSANAGWALESGWQIGPAKVSSGQVQGNADPSVDHSATADNGIAGVFIGGNTPTQLQGPLYLTSPVIDLSNVAGPVTFEFWRWLNSDYPPFMNSTVEAFNGVTWQTLYSVPGPPPVNDSSWNLIQFDVTAYKNANFRVRWSWAVTSPGVYTESSWNIDDVRILTTGSGSGMCP
jgi:hypothetical protein